MADPNKAKVTLVPQWAAKGSAPGPAKSPTGATTTKSVFTEPAASGAESLGLTSLGPPRGATSGSDRGSALTASSSLAPHPRFQQQQQQQAAQGTASTASSTSATGANGGPSSTLPDYSPPHDPDRMARFEREHASFLASSSRVGSVGGMAGAPGMSGASFASPGATGPVKRYTKEELLALRPPNGSVDMPQSLREASGIPDSVLSAEPLPPSLSQEFNPEEIYRAWQESSEKSSRRNRRDDSGGLGGLGSGDSGMSGGHGGSGHGGPGGLSGLDQGGGSGMGGGNGSGFGSSRNAPTSSNWRAAGLAAAGRRSSAGPGPSGGSGSGLCRARARGRRALGPRAWIR